VRVRGIDESEIRPSTDDTTTTPRQRVTRPNNSHTTRRYERQLTNLYRCMLTVPHRGFVESSGIQYFDRAYTSARALHWLATDSLRVCSGLYVSLHALSISLTLCYSTKREVDSCKMVRHQFLMTNAADETVRNERIRVVSLDPFAVVPARRARNQRAASPPVVEWIWNPFVGDILDDRCFHDTLQLRWLD
jgi:hypothetical protein